MDLILEAYQLALDANWQLDKQYYKANRKKGFISIASKDSVSKYGWTEKCYPLDELPDIIQGKADTYSSQNTFYIPSRRVNHIKQLLSLYSDIDCYKSGLTVEQTLTQLENDFFDIVIPTPNLIVHSGRGLYLIWRIAPAPQKALPLWQFAQDWIQKQLEYLGADKAATDAARVLRLAGTVNSKNGETVKAYCCHDEMLDLKEWKRDWLPEQPARKKRAPKGQIRYLIEYSLDYDRANDLKIIVMLRSGECGGHREMILFLYRYWTLLFTKDKSQALEAALELNKQFNEPLNLREVENSTKSAERIIDRDKRYNYSNKRLIDILEITPSEQQKLKTIISKDEKYRRNNLKREIKRRAAGKATRSNYIDEQKKITQNQLQKVKDLLKENPKMKQKEIAEILGVGKVRISRLIKELKKSA